MKPRYRLYNPTDYITVACRVDLRNDRFKLAPTINAMSLLGTSGSGMNYKKMITG